MNKAITLGFGILFGLIGTASLIGVMLGYTQQIVMVIICGVLSVLSFMDYVKKQ
jgi:hypothetical protein